MEEEKTDLLSYWNRELNRRKCAPYSNLVFVIMSFEGKGMPEVYSAIKDECGKLRLTAKKADETIGSGLIIGEIAELIERAEFLICDLSYERPNVYYELGYAHGVGNQSSNILLIAGEGTNLHFDIAPLRANYYRSIDDLRKIVSFNLKGMIQQTRKEGASYYDLRIQELEKEIQLAKSDKLSVKIKKDGLECPHCHQYSKEMKYWRYEADCPFFRCDKCDRKIYEKDLPKISP